MYHVYAHTEVGCNYPAYISITRAPDDESLAIVMRSRGNFGTDSANMLVEQEPAIAMARAILAHYGQVA